MIFPNLAFQQKDEVINDELKIACEYAFDIDTKQFLLRDGKHYFVYENEAIKIWLFKCMATIRNRYRAYTSQFGTELNTLISNTISTDFKKMEVKRFITEAIMVNPYIKSINKIDLKMLDSELIAEVDISTIYGGGGIKNSWSVIQF